MSTVSGVGQEEGKAEMVDGTAFSSRLRKKTAPICILLASSLTSCATLSGSLKL